MKNLATLKKVLFVFVLATTVAFTSQAQKIAIVDVSAILNDMSEYKNAQSQLDDYKNVNSGQRESFSASVRNWSSPFRSAYLMLSKITQIRKAMTSSLIKAPPAG